MKALKIFWFLLSQGQKCSLIECSLFFSISWEVHRDQDKEQAEPVILDMPEHAYSQSDWNIL